MRTPQRAKSLFRVIVVAGAALTGGAAACSGDDDGTGGMDAGEMRDAIARVDTGPMDSGLPGKDGGPEVDSGEPVDAGEDGMVLIL
jgi:hypothetical protein